MTVLRYLEHSGSNKDVRVNFVVTPSEMTDLKEKETRIKQTYVAKIGGFCCYRRQYKAKHKGIYIYIQ